MDHQLGVVARGVTRRFGSVEALRGADLTVPYGQITALVGPASAGKTTLLRILATLLTPDRGAVQVAGVDAVADPGAVRAQMGWAPETPEAHDGLTVREYLTFFAEAHRMPPGDAARMVEYLVGLHRLGDHADRPTKELSRDASRRLALCRALLHRPRVLLLDAPAAGLAPAARGELRDLLRGVAGEGCAVLVTGQTVDELADLADRVAFLVDGRTAAEHDMVSLLQSVVVGWRIRVADVEALLAALGRAGVPPGAVTGAEVELPAMSEDEAADLLTWLVQQGVRVKVFRPSGSPLGPAYPTLAQDGR